MPKKAAATKGAAAGMPQARASATLTDMIAVDTGLTFPNLNVSIAKLRLLSFPGVPVKMQLIVYKKQLTKSDIPVVEIVKSDCNLSGDFGEAQQGNTAVGNSVPGRTGTLQCG